MSLDIKFFLVKNHDKKVTVSAYIYSFFYRLCVDLLPMKKLHTWMGKESIESRKEETVENLRYAYHIAVHVNRITNHLPWEKKCLVRALTVRKFLVNKGISCTIYLGVKMEGDKMVAHAWLRCGDMYLTGGNGQGYTVVTRFAS